MQKCEYCGKEFEPYHTDTQKFCSNKCRQHAYRERNNINTKKYLQRKIDKLPNRICEFCGKEFKPTAFKQVCCCELCDYKRIKQRRKEYYELRKARKGRM